MMGRTRTAAPFALALVATVLLSLNLRIPTTSLGPLLPTIQADTGHGETSLSLLTAIPLALTLLVAPVVPRISARLGRDKAIGYALGFIVAGTVVRSIPGDVALFAGTVLLGAAIAVGTVLAPATIAAAPPRRRASLTGIYTMALSLGPAIALALTVPLMNVSGLSWRGTLMLWAVCGLIALVVWLAYARSTADNSTTGDLAGSDSAPGGPKASDSVVQSASPVETAAPSPGSVIKDPQVWGLAIYLGITSLTFYTSSTWLPTVLVEAGLDGDAAGGYTSLINLVAIPFAFLAPILMRRGLSGVLAPGAALVAVGGVVLLLAVGSEGVLAVSLLLGISQGLCLGVSYGQIVDYAASPEHAASVSALTSAIGIALAALGPLAFGFGLESTGSYVVPMIGLGVVVLLQAGIGLRTGRLRPAGA